MLNSQFQYRIFRSAYSSKEELQEQDFKPEKDQYYERTLITILNDPNDETFIKEFNVKPRPKYPKKVKCSITR